MDQSQIVTTPRKKLIEVTLPLEAINKESLREKSIRHGHPSTLHLWWARRPLAACRAILFGQLVDDPGSVPEEFPDEAAQEKERQRLFRIIEELVKWKNSNNERVIYAARREIARSVARARKETPPKTNAEIDTYIFENAPPVLDPFCGGGSIPLEAKRLGLRAYASDLNPVAVLITKALIEIPPKFAGLQPANPEAKAKLASGGMWSGKGAQGLAEDVRYYGQWMREEAVKRIGHLYPKAKLLDDSEATVIAWLWTRTIKCPNPACGAQMPLVHSFALSNKKGKEVCWVLPVIDSSASPPEVQFEIRTGRGKLPEATVGSEGASCICCFNPVPLTYVRSEGKAGRMGRQLMAVVAKAKRGRVYCSPTDAHIEAARSANPVWRPETDLPQKALGFRVQSYGMTKHADLFTPRQLMALTTFSDLVGEAREKALIDARATELADDDIPLNDGGTGAHAYADAVATYLAVSLDKSADYWSSIASWDTSRETIRGTFARQAIPMVWDFAECNPFSQSTGNVMGAVERTEKTLSNLPSNASGFVKQLDAASVINGIQGPLVCTDPPYYDNIGYADLADFFYIWLRHSLGRVYPNLFKTLLTPKAGELVATPHRFDGDKEKARQFFETGLGQATAHIRTAHAPEYPMTMIYAYKQAKTDGGRNGGTASTGWETMLSGIVRAGFSITGTWPIRSELDNRPVASGTNALASSIVLACRPRSDDALAGTRRDFAVALKRELPNAIRQLQKENIAPVDLQQAAIGPGIAIFSRYAEVLEADGSPMPVRAALIEVNRVLDETLVEQEGDMDSDTRFCVAWFEQYGMAERPYGEAEVLFTAKNTSFDDLQQANVIVGGKGKVRLKRRDELDPGWDPLTDSHVTDWECVQHLVRAMTTEVGRGSPEAARLVVAMGTARAENARALAYRLFTVAERKGWNEEALAYNILVTSSPQIQANVAKLTTGGPAQPELPL